MTGFSQDVLIKIPRRPCFLMMGFEMNFIDEISRGFE